MTSEYLAKTHSLAGKIALVTGSARGIGAGIALELGKKGASVVVNYTSPSSESKAEEVVKAIEAAGGKATLVKANVRDVDDIKYLAEETLKFGNGKIDILVNNAGVSYNKALGDIDLEHYTSQYDINVRAPLFLTQALISSIQPGGRIINISSVSARGGFASQSVYGATKAALEAMTRTWSNEFAQAKGITVNAINPGPVESDMWAAAGEQLHKSVEGSIAMTPSGKRIGVPEDIAKIVGFLAEEGSRWVNGNVLCGNGGIMQL
ncbi:putative Short chain dehydrogenase/reductase family oxidoreductase [Taphrina deformans PYCC 5710]|uniref:Short chain dehydrogenase/reductase family oxidoreductase n=1 Tax=Taphrina deformans (strain PYCC 5710 / ATCC 11124 / CBS 356.35 / IMI 108563 / JCM 9778 / NBRC 8474) TaxID=1097556 RepID=R4XAG5_TAPDE|nr:putative Short chain dehydrogenase/reductase family oxidoreductase [Taphrina deformans PYCC 5710]|eukprot:CCG82497.1 putative Short chain dehydrogenase/reductase family oxidoreductase [Taphrina deformans PYCC 5710]